MTIITLKREVLERAIAALERSDRHTGHQSLEIARQLQEARCNSIAELRSALAPGEPAGGVVRVDDGHTHLCTHCLHTFTPLGDVRCPRCGSGHADMLAAASKGSGG